MPYLGWFDDSKAKTEDKIAGAIAAYEERFRTSPAVVLVNEADYTCREVRGVPVRAEGYIRRNNFWVGE